MAIRTISLDLDAHLPISPQKLRAHQSNDVENIRIIKIGLSRSSCGARAPLTRLISGISWIETQEGVVDLRRNRDWDFAKTKKGGFSLSLILRGATGLGWYMFVAYPAILVMIHCRLSVCFVKRGESPFRMSSVGIGVSRSIAGVPHT